MHKYKIMQTYSFSQIDQIDVRFFFFLITGPIYTFIGLFSILMKMQKHK